MKKIFTTAILTTVIFFSLAPPSWSQTENPIREPPSDFSARYYGEWLLEVSSLITEEEHQVFQKLQTDLEREEFIHLFWKARDPDPDSGRNELREHFLHNVQLAWSNLGNLADHRAQTLIVHGPPRYSYAIECSALHPLILFYYPRNQYGREGFAALFVYDPALAPFYRLWSQEQGFEALLTDSKKSRLAKHLLVEDLAEQGCFSGREHLHGFLTAALEDALSWQELRQRSPFSTRPQKSQWLQGFLTARSQSNGNPQDSRLQAKISPALELTFPFRSGERTVLQGELALPRVAIAPWLGEKSALANFSLQGELLYEEKTSQGLEMSGKERFRQQFHLGNQSLQGEALPLYFYRDLIPGAYTLVLRLEDPQGEVLLHDVRTVEVPQEVPDFHPPPPSEGALHLMPENLSLLNHLPSLQILPFQGLQVGTVEVQVTTTGTAVAAVRYELDGKEVGQTDTAPWTFTVDLGSAPRPHTLRAIALSANGSEIASDAISVNTGAQRFAVRLMEPKAGARSGRLLRARAAVEVPVGATFDRVEFYLGEELAATLFQPPFVQPLTLETSGATTFIKAVAYLRDGTSTDDLVLVNVPGALDEIDVREVEFFANVLNRRRRPVNDLTFDDLRLFEEGVEQQILRFERVLDLPVHLGLLIDSSSSMAAELPLAIESALRFFETLLTPEDQAAVITFNNRTRLAVPFTRDLGWLADGASMLAARGGTALWDSIVGSLNYFGGLKGKRALVLISDGDDQHSRFNFEETLGFARRSGVAIYAISLDLSPPPAAPSAVHGLAALDQSQEHIHQGNLFRKSKYRNQLKELARKTGGLFFGVLGMKALHRAFTAIEDDVRSQYLITYQSSHQGDAFREVQLDVLRPGIKVRAPRGYYP